MSSVDIEISRKEDFQSVSDMHEKLLREYNYFQTIVISGLTHNLQGIKNGPSVDDNHDQYLRDKKLLSSWHYLLVARMALFEASVLEIAQHIFRYWEFYNTALTFSKVGVSNPIRTKTVKWIELNVKHPDFEGRHISNECAVAVGRLFAEQSTEVLYKSKAIRDSILHRAGEPKKSYCDLFPGLKDFIASKDAQKTHYYQLSEELANIFSSTFRRLT